MYGCKGMGASGGVGSPWRGLRAAATNGARGHRSPSIKRAAGSDGVRETTWESGWPEQRQLPGVGQTDLE